MGRSSILSACFNLSVSFVAEVALGGGEVLNKHGPTVERTGAGIFGAFSRFDTANNGLYVYTRHFRGSKLGKLGCVYAIVSRFDSTNTGLYSVF